MVLSANTGRVGHSHACNRMPERKQPGVKETLFRQKPAGLIGWKQDLPPPTTTGNRLCPGTPHMAIQAA
ncbi:hypothetical protein HMPREF9141_0121 [Prevotella multiformis DSM 16608]|uniref:Uncharacterized protein n=1 Tax=Prevotella multiformis DSM 16608 TaxID=888743 RepID=F0F3F5_9BACT|nr:hypothetical protein HMPREF9141_0121 [Prevotella multiformis DSM 16608]